MIAPTHNEAKLDNNHLILDEGLRIVLRPDITDWLGENEIAARMRFNTTDDLLYLSFEDDDGLCLFRMRWSGVGSAQ